MTHYLDGGRDGSAEHDDSGSHREQHEAAGVHVAGGRESSGPIDKLDADWLAFTRFRGDNSQSALVRIRQAFGRDAVYPVGYAQSLRQRLANAILAIPGDVIVPPAGESSADMAEHRGYKSQIYGRSRAAITHGGGVPPTASPRLISANAWFARYIATVVGCVAILVLGVQWVRSAIQANSGTDANPSVYETAMGKRGTFALPDGSVVTLNSGSRMTVGRGFGVSHRNVALSGEAFFVVAGRPDAPFRVYAGTATTQVLGTQFTVRAYSTDSAVQVAVVHGRVLVGHTILGAGDVGRVIAQREPVVSRESDITKYTDWTNGRLVFDDVEFEQIIPQLERMYDIEIRVADAVISRRRLSGTLSDRAADHAMQYVAIMLHARYEREGRVVTLFNNSR